MPRRTASCDGRRRRGSGVREQGHQHHRRVVDVGVELVGVLEVPAARLDAGPARLPVARIADLLRQQPVDGAGQRRLDPRRWPASARAIVAMAVSQTGEMQGCSRGPSPSSITQVVELPPAPSCIAGESGS